MNALSRVVSWSYALSLAGLFGGAVAVSLGPNPAQAQNKDAEPTIGELIVQTIPARHYIYASFETDFKSMVKPIQKNLPVLMKAAAEKKVGLHGPLMHYYYGAPHQHPDKGFKMETGWFVPEGTEPLGEFKVRELPKLKCATMLYVGPVNHRIGETWQKLHQAIRAKGLTPTDEERELYLYFEGPDSSNNIVQAQVGIK